MKKLMNINGSMMLNMRILKSEWNNSINILNSLDILTIGIQIIKEKLNADIAQFVMRKLMMEMNILKLIAHIVIMNNV